MTTIEKLNLKNRILGSKKIQRMTQISMSLDYSLKKDYAESRLTHSVKVANATELISLLISEKTGIRIDFRNTFYFVGLLHDVGHTAFSHEGERLLDSYTKKESNGKLFFDSNSNNYETIKKNNLLDGFSLDDHNYILASLAKHPEALYESQGYIQQLIEEETEKESILLGFDKQDKTLACQIMDIADENCYVVSDIVDAENILTKSEMEVMLRKLSDSVISNKLIKAVYKGKSSLINEMNNLFELFNSNLTLINGKVIVENEEIEKIKTELMKIVYENIILHTKVQNVRKKNLRITKIVFEYFFSKRILRSQYYRKEYAKASNELDKIAILRNMLGGLTDKSIKQIYKEIK